MASAKQEVWQDNPTAPSGFKNPRIQETQEHFLLEHICYNCCDSPSLLLSGAPCQTQENKVLSPEGFLR